MHRRVGILILLVLVAGGCSRDASPPAASTPAASPTTAQVTDTTSAAAQGPEETSGNMPDPCTLLSDAEVTELTGRQITQIDKDGADATAPTRYCQWQQDSGQLAVFITRSTAHDFAVAKSDAASIPGIGDDAYWEDGHLFVLIGGTQLDVYSRGADASQEQAEAEKVAGALVPKVRAFS